MGDETTLKAGKDDNTKSTLNIFQRLQVARLRQLAVVPGGARLEEEPEPELHAGQDCGCRKAFLKELIKSVTYATLLTYF